MPKQEALVVSSIAAFNAFIYNASYSKHKNKKPGGPYTTQ